MILIAPGWVHRSLALRWISSFFGVALAAVGDGRTAMFWDSSWVNGHAPRDLAPNLYKLACRKGLKLREEVQNQAWTRGLWRMSTATGGVCLFV